MNEQLTNQFLKKGLKRFERNFPKLSKKSTVFTESIVFIELTKPSIPKSQRTPTKPSDLPHKELRRTPSVTINRFRSQPIVPQTIASPDVPGAFEPRTPYGQSSKNQFESCSIGISKSCAFEIQHFFPLWWLRNLFFVTFRAIPGEERRVKICPWCFLLG